ncbi:hypothetical protein [Streptomyces sp. ML-6]|uniref:hypothetical protein n=1 Tax=Streptomyces sp. ML-6 TaxID=2982693 RepID=UPI0024BF1728|nr:hypothetical protein [Streptomyces sp. ML-6]MDK0524993.1 hypothetical protein [Streptomyces sp. ML-6]
MRHMRGVGAVVAGIAAVVVLSGCGGDEAKPASSPSASEGTADAKPSEPVPSEAAEYPATPEGDIDRLADEKGWVVDDLYPAASDFVTDICESLPVSAVDGVSRPQWLAESGNFDGDGKAVLQAGIPKLCPKWSPVLKQAVSGRYDRWFGDGTYVVSSEPGAAEDEETIPPGTYRARGSMKDCYWERTTKGGDIIDNNLATSAQEITVTIRASDGQFTSERCAVWKPVK